jgi:hypothetical protein
LWRPASNSARTRAVNSGSACSISFHAGTAGIILWACLIGQGQAKAWRHARRDLITLKRATGRPEDIGAAEELEELERLEANEPA